MLKLLFNKIFYYVRKNSDQVAFLLGEKKYTYADFILLIGFARQKLQILKVSKNDRIGICTETRIESYAFIFAALSMGAAFVPLSTEEAPERLKKIIIDSNLKVIVFSKQATISKIQNNFEFNFFYELPENFISEALESQSKEALLEEFTLDEESIIYIMYTSGSTGVPKGVMISYDCLDHFLSWAISYFNISEKDVFLAHTKLTFDLSLFHLITPFLVGAAVRLPESSVDLLAPGEIFKKNITIALIVPRLTGLMMASQQIYKNAFPNLRHLLFCGEKLYANQVNIWLTNHENLRVHNLYGPTEATVACSCLTLTSVVEDPVSIGLPFGENYFEIRNTGELIISGKQVSKFDYLNLKTNSFFENKNAVRSYNTGDLVEKKSNGQYYWLNRLDSQIKIKGMRVELGEIEEAFLKSSQINEVACLFEPKTETLYLFYNPLVLDQVENVEAELIELSRLSLPLHMQPKKFICLEQMPRTAHGKVDKNQLLNKYTQSSLS